MSRWWRYLFPPRWRARYADEFAALLEAQPTGQRQAVDIVRAALDAWLRPQLGTAAAAPAPAGGRPRARTFDRFTPRSRALLLGAEQAATALGHDSIGTEHLLLALARSDGLGMLALARLGFDRERIERALQPRLLPRVLVSDPARRGLTPRAKEAVALSVKEARRLRDAYLGTEHLLLGLLRAEGSLAAQALGDLGAADLERVRRVVAQVQREGSPRA